jgi:3-phenylpropionate/cinnamic acid dioxygenase small subunit
MKLHRTEAEDFLFHEAELLDQRRYDEWLKLFTADGIYWLPMEDGSDPQLVPSILYDDKKMMQMRVHQFGKRHYSQRPPSRTVHAISNVTVAAGAHDNEAIVRCVAMVTELREGDYLQRGLGEQRLFSGHCEYRLRQEEQLAIVMKKLVLINRESPIVNLSFLL